MSAATLTSIDLLDLDRWARDGFPHAWFADLRRTAPVWRHPSPVGGPGFWVVSGHAEVVALGRCPHILSSDSENGGVTGLDPADPLWSDVDPTAGIDPDAKMLLTMDPPEHTRYRKVVNRAFTPARIAALEPKVREVAVELVDAAAGRTLDVTTEVAMPLPMRVICDMIGAPREDHHQLMRWGNALVASSDPEYRIPQDEQFSAIGGLLRYFGEMRERSAGEPGNDLCSVLVDAEVDGERLSVLRFNFFLLLLAVAGNETTRNAISHGVAAFAEHPEQWRRLRAQPELVPTAVEEILRWASPVAHFRRTAVAPMDVAGAHIEVGDVVSLWYPSANRDEHVFADPDRFDVGRHPNPHVTFGGGGPHFCLGASLARLELRVVLEELLRRVDRIEPAGPIELLRSNFLNGVKHLPVRLTA